MDSYRHCAVIRYRSNQHVTAASQSQGPGDTNRDLERLTTTASVHSKTLTELEDLRY